MNSGKVLLGLLAGFTAGTLLGMLFAPDKSSRTGKRNFWGSDREEDETDERFNEFIDDIAEKYEDLKEEIAGEKSKAKAK